jgi:DNA transposition AAA+ family ATPase
VNSLLNDKSGAIIGYKYSGIITMTPAIGAVLAGADDAKTTEFGNVGRSLTSNKWNEMKWEI